MQNNTFPKTNKFNIALDDISAGINRTKKGKDILFIEIKIYKFAHCNF